MYWIVRFVPSGIRGALAHLALYQFRLGQYHEARRLAGEALAALPGHSATVTALTVLGLRTALTDEWAEAEAHYRRAAAATRAAYSRLWSGSSKN